MTIKLLETLTLFLYSVNLSIQSRILYKEVGVLANLERENLTTMSL